MRKFLPLTLAPVMAFAMTSRPQAVRYDLEPVNPVSARGMYELRQLSKRFGSTCREIGEAETQAVALNYLPESERADDYRKSIVDAERHAEDVARINENRLGEIVAERDSLLKSLGCAPSKNVRWLCTIRPVYFKTPATELSTVAAHYRYVVESPDHSADDIEFLASRRSDPPDLDRYETGRRAEMRIGNTRHNIHSTRLFDAVACETH